MTSPERAAALQGLGFTERQAQFLVTVALHGGYCLRRHYQAFAGIEYGRNIRCFLEGLVESRFANRLLFRPDRGHVYHLHAKAIYRALGQENNRNRRPVSKELIARKFMTLDVVLGDVETEWFATEQDKIALFTDRLFVPLHALPKRVYESRDPARAVTTRYFVHKLPVGLKAGSVSLVYVAAEFTGDAFASFLNDHAGLLAHLPSWTIQVACAPHVPSLKHCRAVCKEFITRHSATINFRPGQFLLQSAPHDYRHLDEIP